MILQQAHQPWIVQYAWFAAISRPAITSERKAAKVAKVSSGGALETDDITTVGRDTVAPLPRRQERGAEAVGYTSVSPQE